MRFNIINNYNSLTLIIGIFPIFLLFISSFGRFSHIRVRYLAPIFTLLISSHLVSICRNLDGLRNKQLIIKLTFQIAVVCLLIMGLIYSIIGSRDSKEANTKKLIDKIPTSIGNKSRSKGEIQCHIAITNITGEEFMAGVRPNILKNPDTKRNLELDVYNEQLKIAIEYQGEQHYKIVKSFGMDENSMKKQKERDQLKRELCKKNNIMLIEVPYTVKLNDIEKYLRNELKKLGYK